MNLVSLTTVAIRVVAVLALIVGFRASVAGLVYLWGESARDAHIAFFVSGAVWLLAAAGLWVFAAGAARAITSASVQSESDQSLVEPKELEVLLITILGLYFFLDAAIDLTYWISAIVWQGRMYPGEVSLAVDQKAGILRMVAQLVISLLVVLRARGVSSLIHRLREAGHN